MLIRIEGDRMWNDETGDVFELKHRDGTATVWFCGVRIISDSAVVYKHIVEKEKAQQASG